MKQKLIKTDKATLLLLKLPEGVNKCKIYSDVLKNNFLGGVNISNLKVFKIQLPPGNWQPLGFAKEVSEEVAKESVHVSIHSGLFAHYIKDIPVNTYCYKTALESFHSLLQANEVYLVNPLTHPINFSNLNNDEYDKYWIKWYDTQQNTGNWYILKLIK